MYRSLKLTASKMFVWCVWVQWLVLAEGYKKEEKGKMRFVRTWRLVVLQKVLQKLACWMSYQSPQSPGGLLQHEMTKDRLNVSGYTESRTGTALPTAGIKEPVYACEMT